VARTPSNLTNLLTARQIPQSTLNSNLHITQGSSKDPPAVLAALTTTDPTDPAAPPRPVDLIISGIGGKPVFWPNPLRPKLDDLHVCEESARVLLDAVSKLDYGERGSPVIVAISTTGLPGSPVRDVPLLMLPLYRLLLHHPHEDKKRMEGVLLPEDPPPNHPTCVVVRASLLTDGPRQGVEKVRSGTEEKPAVGYTISREDVGGWLAERIVENTGRREEWGGKKVTITY
jgi:hypothetical protein